MMNLAWRLISKPNSLCAQVLKAIYYPDGKLEDTVFAGNASSSWQAIAYGLDLLKNGLVWRVGNRRSIQVWRDNWIPRPFSYKLITVQGMCRIRFVSDLLNENGSWNLALLQQYFLPADVEEILKIRASSRLGDYMLAWGPGKYDIFFLLRVLTNSVLKRHTEARLLAPVRALMADDLAGNSFGPLMYAQVFETLLGAWLPTLCRLGETNIFRALK